MAGISYFLNRVGELCKSIQELEFQSAGIFTNSFIAEPSITTLLKDAEDFELALYRVHKSKYFTEGQEKSVEAKPQRLDGNSIYKEHSFDEFINGDQTPDASFKRRKRIAVRVPELTQLHQNQNHISNLSSEPSSEGKTTSPRKIINLSESNDVKEVIKNTFDLIAKYPHLVTEEEEETINAYNEKYVSLLEDIKQLEKTVSDQKELLAIYNVSLSDVILLSSPLKQKSNDEEDIDELIRQEQFEIDELEKQLELAQAL